MEYFKFYTSWCYIDDWYSSGTYLIIIGLVAGFISLKEIKNSKWIAWLGILLNAVGLGGLVI